MKTLKEKWVDALPVFASVALMMFILWMLIVGVNKLVNIFPTQAEALEELKLCRDNNFDARQAENGHWYCAPFK